MRDDGTLIIQQIDAAELSPGEFTARVRRCVEQHDIRTVVIDSLNGYQAAMPEEHFLLLHMHELLQFLNRQGATTFLTVAQHGLVGDMKAPVDVTYLADTVLLLRYFEAAGRSAAGGLGDQEARRASTRRPSASSRSAISGLIVGEPLDGIPGRAARRARTSSAQAPG